MTTFARTVATTRATVGACALASLASLGMPARRAAAQGVPRTQAGCNGQTVNDIIVHAHPPSFGGIFNRSELLMDAVRVLHSTSNEKVIRRYVLLKRGQPCSAHLRQETERILRAQPFLASASVTAYADPGGSGVIVEVVTVDETEWTAATRIEGSSPYLTAFTLGNGNVNGQAVHALVDWRRDPFYRDQFKARLDDYQFLGKPMYLSLFGARRFQGGVWSAELGKPFFTDVQRSAWRLATGDERIYMGLSRGEGAPEVSYGLRRRSADIGGIVRLGSLGRLSLFGLSLSHEEEMPASGPVQITRTGVLSDSTPELMGLYHSRRTARINVLWGVRSIDFLAVRGFDALSAAQDVRRGFQLGTVFGRSLAVLGSQSDDIFLSADVYAGAGTERLFSALQVNGEGRQNYDDNQWESILGSGRFATYWKVAPRHTTILSAEWSGGWKQRIPYQLTIGEQTGGVRGYEFSEVPGGTRGVARLENRYLLGNIRGTADAGIALFADAGRTWAGDVPFGVDSPIYSSIGVSLLAAVPPRSKRLWRMELGFPLRRGVPGAGVEFRLFSSSPTRTFWTEPDDVLRSRSKAVPGSIFNWP